MIRLCAALLALGTFTASAADLTQGFVADKVPQSAWYPPMAVYRTKALPFARCYLYSEKVLLVEDDPATARNLMTLCANTNKSKNSSACECDKSPTRAVRHMDAGWLLGIQGGRLYWNSGDSETKGTLFVFDLSTGKKLLEQAWRGDGFERKGTTLVDRFHRVPEEQLAKISDKPACREMTEEETIQINYGPRVVTTMTVDLKTMKTREDNLRCEILEE